MTVPISNDLNLSPSADAPFNQWMLKLQQRIEAVLSHKLDTTDSDVPQALLEAVRYVLLGGGKRIRALLCYAAGELVHAPIERIDVLAAAIECIHAYSLVHDDLPCMDDDSLRRGKPCCHVAYGEAMALLVGDGLQALAFEWLATPGLCRDPLVQLQLVHQLARASGLFGMVGGQTIDLSSVAKHLNQDELEHMHALKTGALISASISLPLHLGEYACDPNMYSLVVGFSKQLGLLFQIVDDILDATSSTDVLGKTAGKDDQHNKPTYVSVLGLENAQVYASQSSEQAYQLLSQLPRTERLRSLLNYVTQRSF